MIAYFTSQYITTSFNHKLTLKFVYTLTVCKLARYLWDGLHYEITMKDILLYANPENDDNPDNINYCLTAISYNIIQILDTLYQ